MHAYVVYDCEKSVVPVQPPPGRVSLHHNGDEKALDCAEEAYESRAPNPGRVLLQ